MEKRVKVFVRLKEGVLDPQGKAICNALNALGFKNVSEVKVGKLIELKIKGSNKGLKEDIAQMCKKLLANPVIENYSFEIEGKKKR